MKECELGRAYAQVSECGNLVILHGSHLCYWRMVQLLYYNAFISSSKILWLLVDVRTLGKFDPDPQIH